MSASAIPKPVWEQSTKRFTREEYERIIEAGVFEGRYELIDGELVNKMGQNPDHAYTIQLVLNWLARIFGVELVRVQLSILASGPDRNWSVPEPDLALLREWKSEYQHRHPNGDELWLVVEVAGSSIHKDLARKAEIYATALVPEYWVLDLERRQLVVHLDPQSGQYRLVRRFNEDERATLNGRAEQLRVGDLLPSRT